MRLHAISDLHLAHRENRDALAEFVATRDYRDDWLIVAGDVGERPEHLTLALEQLTRAFAHPCDHSLTNAFRGVDIETIQPYGHITFRPETRQEPA